MRVLIDGGYRSSPLGTGISSYARMLEAGLARLGHEVVWLSGAHVSGAANPLSDSAHAADDELKLGGLRRYLRTAHNMSAGLLKGTSVARPLSNVSRVITRHHDLPQMATLLAPDVFVHAHYRHMLLRRFTEVMTTAQIDVLHLTAPLPIKMGCTKTVLTIHDLVPIRLPYTTSDNKREFIDRVLSGVRLADLVVTVSESTKRDIVDLLEVDPARVVVTWQPTDVEPLSPDETTMLPRSLARYGLEQNQYAIFVGAIEPKKNVRRLIDAFLEADDSMPLVLVGQRAWKWECEIGDLDQRLSESARKRIRMVGHVPRDDLRKLLAGARLLAFPSLHEGFGLPALEAMRMGCPVLSSHAGGLAEVCGNASLVVDPWDTNSIRRGITKMIEDDVLRSNLRVQGFLQAAKFSPEAFLSRLAEAYLHLV